MIVPVELEITIRKTIEVPDGTETNEEQMQAHIKKLGEQVAAKVNELFPDDGKATKVSEGFYP